MSIGGDASAVAGDDAEPAPAPAPDPAVLALRRQALALGRLEASRLVLVADLDQRVRAAALASCDGLADQAREFTLSLLDDLVVGEVQVALGLSDSRARALVHLADRVVRVTPRLLASLRSGLLDLPRVRTTVEGTAHLDDATALAVVDALLDRLDTEHTSAPWDGPSPRAWRDRVATAVVRADPAAARRRQQAAEQARCVRTWTNDDGTGTFAATGPAADIIDIEQVITALAQAWPQVDQDGQRLTMDQRRWHATVQVFRTIATGRPLPAVAIRREREIGLVLAADTLFDDGPAKNEPGQLRGLGSPTVLDPTTSRATARDQLGWGTNLAVLLTDKSGALHRVVRLTRAPAGGWTRATLVAAVKAALPTLPPLRVPTHTPSTAITDHVRAARPRCSGYDCARTARGTDLDHDTPWPRGPTATWNLDPKCRRHHQRKTLALWHSRLHPDGSLTWTSLLGTSTTVRHEPLPGAGR